MRKIFAIVLMITFISLLADVFTGVDCVNILLKYAQSDAKWRVTDG